MLMNKIKIKVVSLITAIELMLFKARVYAVSLNDIDPKEPTGNEITGVGEKVIGIVTMLGSILAVLVLVILGIKYMMGSTDEKAEYKKSMLPYVIGAVLVFAASSIASVIYNLAIKL
ncbi:MAG: hypothetical protein EGQ16_07690 [Clostridiales bacterium]|nr:hypothetical protein [Clostridiales bacterium]